MLRSLATRTSRVVLGALSIWCLGCASLDIVLDQLLLGGATSELCVMPGDTAQQSLGDRVSTIRQSDDAPADACGCDHCVAVRAAVASAVAPQRLTPDSVAHVPGDAPSVIREPLVPPPIGRIAA